MLYMLKDDNESVISKRFYAIRVMLNVHVFAYMKISYFQSLDYVYVLEAVQ